MTKYFKYAFIAVFAILALLFLLPRHVSAGGISIYDPCPSGTGPGGITAGDYPPTSLTQDQRQWLFTAFGNAGIASDGYGGQRCGVPRPTDTPYVAPPPTAVPPTDVPPTVIPPTTVPPTAVPPTNPPANSPTDTPKPVVVPTLRPCPPGTGPGDITAGDYDPTKLTQDQRQWLFTAFGNAGIASDGYGGQRCGSGVSSPPPCPLGSGPDGITAGSYDPTKLTQAQRQWLFEKFGHGGTASDGYGGEACSGGIPYTPGQSSGGSGGNSTSGGSNTKTCPSGTGPDGITAGSYDPTKLTQEQRNWLFNIFGNPGIASVGYGGQACSGGVPFTPGSNSGSTQNSGQTNSGTTTTNNGSATGQNTGQSTQGQTDQNGQPQICKVTPYVKINWGWRLGEWFALVVPNSVHEPYTIYYEGQPVPDNFYGILHDGFVGYTDTTFWLGINTTKFVIPNLLGIFNSINWLITYQC